MGREYIKLVAINVGDFESQISFERNYPDTEEGQKTCQQDKKMCEEKGFICNFVCMHSPVVA